MKYVYFIMLYMHKLYTPWYTNLVDIDILIL